MRKETSLDKLFRRLAFTGLAFGVWRLAINNAFRRTADGTYETNGTYVVAGSSNGEM